MATADLDHARAAKDKLVALLADRHAINGIGIAAFEGGFCIKINLDRPSDEELPVEFDGVPVTVEVVGTIRKRDPA
jgi:hypothetical protein